MQKAGSNEEKQRQWCIWPERKKWKKMKKKMKKSSHNGAYGLKEREK